MTEKTHRIPVVPMGKLEGHRIALVPTAFLLWTISQDGIRAKRPDYALDILDERQNRFLREFPLMVKELNPRLSANATWVERKQEIAAMRCATAQARLTEPPAPVQAVEDDFSDLI
jgi:hypothetical protein